MTTFVFAVIAIVCLALAMHPFVTYPLSLLALRRVRGRVEVMPEGAVNPQTFAICMCAYNEERVIEAKVKNLLELRARHPDLEILIYVDAATDRTAEILRRYAEHFYLHVSKERHGKTYGMNLLSTEARADVLVFTDANVMLAPDCLEDLTRYFADREIGCVCGNLNYTNSDASVTAASGSLYWRFEEGLKRLEADTGSTMGADGSIFAIRRTLRRPPPDHIIDDMYVSLMVLVDGYRMIQAADVRAYEESVPSSSEEFGRKVRIACQAFNVHRLLWPRLRMLDGLTQYKYISHKLLRWLSIYFLVLAGLAALAALLSADLAILAGVLVVLAIAGLFIGYQWPIKPFAQIVDLLSALCGAGLGVWRSLRGERFQTWTPAGSIRGKAGT
jgi:cellulose synthase/poly-beta-1,6-N-acetylglucosamine synthase-like glycosyltransferase